jgi:hypothetical protein
VTKTDCGRGSTHRYFYARPDDGPSLGGADWYTVGITQFVLPARAQHLADFQLYLAQMRIRNFVGFMIRKLSVTSSHQTFQFFGTSSRKKFNIAMLKSLKLA